MFEEEWVGWLAEVGERVGGGDPVEAVGGWDRIIGWAQAGQLRAMDAVAGLAPGWITGSSGPTRLSDVQVAGAEVAALLSVSRVTATGRVQLAVNVLDRLPDSLAALEDGRLTLPKLRAIEDATSVLDPALARRVEAIVLPAASEQTMGELTEALRTAVITIDPAAAEARRKKAIKQRKVTTVPQPDGMAGLWASMPAEKVVAAYSVVDSVARLAKTHDDDRCMDELRADTLYDLILHAHDQLTGAAPTGILAGVLATSPPRAQNTNPPPAAAAPSRRRSTRLWSINLTVPAETILGTSQAPAHLPSYGPITAHAARDIAAADATWRRILFDPITGTVLDVDHTAYQPTRSITEHVLARDKMCRHPGCRQPAARCDLDHTTRYPDGPTTTDNIAALCRFHHRLKHHTTWKITQDSAGVITWTSPTGRTHTTYPWDYRNAPWLNNPPQEHITEADLECDDLADPYR